MILKLEFYIQFTIMKNENKITVSGTWKNSEKTADVSCGAQCQMKVWDPLIQQL
jgi:hypothetical protein